jgi:hypothetical protein
MRPCDAANLTCSARPPVRCQKLRGYVAFIAAGCVTQDEFCRVAYRRVFLRDHGVSNADLRNRYIHRLNVLSHGSIRVYSSRLKYVAGGRSPLQRSVGPAPPQVKSWSVSCKRIGDGNRNRGTSVKRAGQGPYQIFSGARLASPAHAAPLSCVAGRSRAARGAWISRMWIVLR